MKRLGWALAIAWVLSVGYAAEGLNRGWIPHDEGTIGQSADRVLAGQLPHRDYDEIYTGGLAVVDAAAFRVFGASLLSPRLVLLLVFALWVPAMFYVASRFLGPVAAAGATLAAAVWSIPNYSAAMPSWFNLFFAGFGVACLIRHAETNAGRWVFWAGVCGGVSCLFKIVGLYYIAGALLFLVYREQAMSSEAPERTAAWFRVLVAGALLLFVAGILDLLRGRWTGGDIGLFAFPS
ncbi:MAG TPA: glycosyltransferase family 39 protein, partial [Gemmatimonadales bacterium]|nr:glycosyltransferase family 39 protein [Gemmatimonadales bacterium]